jgi:hypothetical protein
MAKKKKSEDIDEDIVDKFCKAMDKKKDTAEFKASLEELNKKIADYDHRHDEARKHGKAIGKRLCKKYKATPYEIDGKMHKEHGLNTDEASAAIAEILYQCYTYEQQSDCGELLNEWIHEKLWGKVITDYIPQLKEVWQYLHDNKYTKDNTLGYGDIDGAIWVEYVRQEEEWEDKRKIIIHTSHCSCADDNTHIFILNEEGVLGKVLHVRTVWPREKNKGKHKYKKQPSINTYRKNNFKFGYQDGRDTGYSLTLEGKGTPKVEWAHHYQGRIQHVVWLIDQMKLIITDESYQCK